MKKVRILITGISGYIGSKLLREFVESNKNFEYILNFKKKPDDYQKYSQYTTIYNSIEKKFSFQRNVDILVHIASEKYLSKKMTYRDDFKREVLSQMKHLRDDHH